MQRILIVEDEPDMADMIGFQLQRAGYEVIQAHDGIEGNEAAWRECPDLIVLDIMLPQAASPENLPLRPVDRNRARHRLSRHQSGGMIMRVVERPPTRARRWTRLWRPLVRRFGGMMPAGRIHCRFSRRRTFSPGQQHDE